MGFESEIRVWPQLPMWCRRGGYVRCVYAAKGHFFDVSTAPTPPPNYKARFMCCAPFRLQPPPPQKKQPGVLSLWGRGNA